MKKLLVLDIDHTLIHSVTWKTNENASFQMKFTGDDHVYRVYERNNLRRFIQTLKQMLNQYFKVAVWTAAQRPYAVKILDNIWPKWKTDLLFLRTFAHCTVNSDGNVYKDLSMLPSGYDILLVDDNSLTHLKNTQNGYPVWKIAPFYFNSHNLEKELMTVLLYILTCIKTNSRFEKNPKHHANRLKMLVKR